MSVMNRNQRQHPHDIRKAVVYSNTGLYNHGAISARSISIKSVMQRGAIVSKE